MSIENLLSIGTKLGYIFVLSARVSCLFSEFAFGNLESGKLCSNLYDILSHTYRAIFLVSRVAFFSALTCTRVRTYRFTLRSLYLLSSSRWRIVVHSKTLVPEFLLSLLQSHSQEENIPMHKYIYTKHAVRTIFQLNSLALYFFFPFFSLVFISFFDLLLLLDSSTYFFPSSPLNLDTVTIRTFFQFSE